ncbi:MAG: prepilin-type N-terminal cleavage/methylation domain-containing protein [Nitrospinae bacterium]|nr:prepilin-type N-terminal cleavage/methylation domain-containing protein [Nitrospinota bacterium]
MKSLSTPSPELPKLIRKLNNKGFSLLEVIVALAIMAIGYLTVFNLFSVSIKAVGMSDQYQRAVGLANSKLSEIEMLNYETAATSGTFENEENFRWSLNIEPYDSPLNDPEQNINLSKVTLKVLWKDNQKPRNVELVTLKLNGEVNPAPDSQLAKVWREGITSSGTEDPTQDPAQEAQPTASSASSSGVSETTEQGISSISGAPQPPGKVNISGFGF